MRETPVTEASLGLAPVAATGGRIIATLPLPLNRWDKAYMPAQKNSLPIHGRPMATGIFEKGTFSVQSARMHCSNTSGVRDTRWIRTRMRTISLRQVICGTRPARRLRSAKR